MSTWEDFIDQFPFFCVYFPPKLEELRLPPRCVSENTLQSEGEQSVLLPRSELHSQDTAGSRDRDLGLASCVQSEESTARRQE